MRLGSKCTGGGGSGNEQKPINKELGRTVDEGVVPSC